MNVFCILDGCESLGGRGQTVINGIMLPQRGFNPRTCGYVALHGKRDFADVYS